MNYTSAAEMPDCKVTFSGGGGGGGDFGFEVLLPSKTEKIPNPNATTPAAISATGFSGPPKARSVSALLQLHVPLHQPLLH